MFYLRILLLKVHQGKHNHCLLLLLPQRRLSTRGQKMINNKLISLIASDMLPFIG